MRHKERRQSPLARATTDESAADLHRGNLKTADEGKMRRRLWDEEWCFVRIHGIARRGIQCSSGSLRNILVSSSGRSVIASYLPLRLHRSSDTTESILYCRVTDQILLLRARRLLTLSKKAANAKNNVHICFFSKRKYREKDMESFKQTTFTCSLALTLLFLVFSVVLSEGALQTGFYNGKCGNSNVEDIIRRAVVYKFVQDPTIVPALLRLQFHDCFVEGCDASLLLDGKNAEKTAIPNLSVRGYDVIDAAKQALETACANVVSCADIIIAATRDVVSLAGGVWYEVEMGRRDGNISLASNVNLPPPTISVSDSIAAFANKGLSTTDMVLLLGGHTVGITHCSFFSDRLYNFNGTGGGDPAMNPLLAFMLKLRCPKNSKVNSPVNLDQNPLSAKIVDNSFYREIIKGNGILQIDQSLAFDVRTKEFVQNLALGFNFPYLFNNALIKMGRIGVLTGEEGEDCDASLLVDRENTKKIAVPNLTVRGYDVIDAAKQALEKVCPNVVPCGDIIVADTRDVVSLISMQTANENPAVNDKRLFYSGNPQNG
ncbi:Peroxidase 60 [Platanthera zijinensis]|uniref:peroxidase n=1 Tax=Platanthera zijinensis TaxID=2320716 RepID=A0AAP0BIH3_9ASPA